MTALSPRCLLAWRMGAVLVCVVVALAALAAPLRAQPFAAAIMDVRTGEFLWETENANSRVHPASLTKMMTLYIVFEALENGEITLDTQVRVSRHAAAQPPSRLGLRAGQTIALRYLIRAAALRSANDAATALAEAVEGSVANFSVRMNRTAAAIGMTRTRFSNPHGLTAEGHLSSARDMSRLGRQLYFDYPQYYGIFSRRSEHAGIATVTNTNGRFLDSYRGADGIKTGFTNAAGYNLTAMAERDGVRILVTVMGARSGADRLRRVTELMDRGFREAPRRASTRRPATPSYTRAPEDRGLGVAAGRTIRLQTAPTRSPFPRARPEPGQPPSEDLLASLRSGIDEVIEEIREPDPLADTDDPGVAAGESSEEPDEPMDGETPRLAAVAPESSPVPRQRPVIEVVARASAGGVQVIAEPAEPPAPEVPGPSQTALPVSGANAGPVGVTFGADGSLLIPGLPPILTTEGAIADTPATTPTTLSPTPEAPTDTSASDQPTASATTLAVTPIEIEPVITDLRVDDEGRILWRDEELLAALRNGAEVPGVAPTIVLTTSDSGAGATLSTAPMPEIIDRVSTSGGRLYRVELGLHASRFDAERALLRLALSESATLGAGVRHVTPRQGRFVAEVASLSQAEAELACARLIARDQACVVVAP